MINCNEYNFYLYCGLFFFTAGYFIISNTFQILLKLSYPIEQLFLLLPAGFEFRNLLSLVSDADTLTN